jgi:hypothetical protein
MNLLSFSFKFRAKKVILCIFGVNSIIDYSPDNRNIVVDLGQNIVAVGGIATNSKTAIVDMCSCHITTAGLGRIAAVGPIN